MKEESLIKILVVILLILFFIIRNRFTNYYKKFSFKFLIKYLIVIVIMLFYFSNIIDFAIVSINVYFRIIFGLFFILSGYYLLFIAHKHLGRNWSSLIDKKLSRGDYLVKTGPYKYIRHPTYVASILALIGFGVLIANWIIFSISLLILFVFYFYKVPREEKFLMDKFGKKYLEYKKKTGGFFPKIK